MKKLLKKCKFGLGELQGLAITLVIIALVAAIGLQILGDQQADMTVDSAEYNATGDGIEAIGQIPSKLPMIVGVVLGVIVIGIVVAYLSFRKR